MFIYIYTHLLALLCMYIHTEYVHSYTSSFFYTQKQQSFFTCKRQRAHTHTHECTYTQTHTFTHSLTHPPTQTRTNTCTNGLSHTPAKKHKHRYVCKFTYTIMHTHIYISTLIFKLHHQTHACTRITCDTQFLYVMFLQNNYQSK